MVNDEIISRLFGLLRQYTEELKAEKDIKWADFTDNIRVKRFSERTLQMCIEVCFDIGNHIISDEGWIEAKTNREIFIRLNEKTIISNDLLVKLSQMASFRNQLVHDYSEIEPEIVFGILKNHIVDFETYMVQILKWIEGDRNNECG